MQNDTSPLFPNLTAAISRKGLSRRELADALGISLSTLGRRLRGNIEFRWNELYRLHDLFPDMPLRILLERSTRPYQSNKEVHSSCQREITANTADAEQPTTAAYATPAQTS